MNKKDKFEQQTEDRRAVNRKKLTMPVGAKFSFEVDAQVIEISPEGMTIVFDPIEDGLNRINKSIPIHLDMNDNLVSIDASIRQITKEADNIRLGISYDRSQIAVFYSPFPKNNKDRD